MIRLRTTALPSARGVVKPIRGPSGCGSWTQKAAKHKPVCIQVKSRYATDSDRGFPVKERTFGSFDYLVVVFLNIGNYFGKNPDCAAGRRNPEFYTFPARFIEEHHDKKNFGGKVMLGKLNIEKYKNEKGFELIADALGIEYPARP